VNQTDRFKAVADMPERSRGMARASYGQSNGLLRL